MSDESGKRHSGMMIGVECPECNGKGHYSTEVRSVDGTRANLPAGPCLGPHVVLEIPVTEWVCSHVSGVGWRGRHQFHSFGKRVFADPGKIMWWCKENNDFVEAACKLWQAEYGEHLDCGWVARPAQTWKEGS